MYARRTPRKASSLSTRVVGEAEARERDVVETVEAWHDAHTGGARNKTFSQVKNRERSIIFCGKKTVFKFILKPNRTFQTKRPNASSVVEYTRRRVVLVCKEENFFFPPRIVRVRLVTFGDIAATAYRWKSTPGDNYY